ncbi:unnamed protein product [Linum tenue]|uniref:THH1/TOM1/TOM3 domain-containing protein n=1 Tax=Linum tenue TaxID=586396 RepID=A0AAV0PY19_9ROSI|nr:unnamed protein product [Linum tenue]
MFGAATERSSSCCFHPGVLAVNVGLASLDGILAFLAFYQVFHVLVGSSNLGYFLYFAASPIAYHNKWLCWSYSCGFILMAFSKILFFGAFLLLLSFWVDLCHQADDEDYEEEDFNFHEPLLEMPPEHSGSTHGESQRACLPFRSIRVGSRQRVVILVIILAFVSTITCAALFWIDMSNGFSHSSLLAMIYEDISDVVMLLLGGALACYGLVLYLKMRRVRSERAASDIWKVAGLAVVAVICFTTSALVAFLANIPVRYNWQQLDGNDLLTSVLLILYYFIGSSVPSAFLLWIMRELPPPLMSSVPEESTTITFVSDSTGVMHNPQRWTTSASLQNQRGEKQAILSPEARQRLSGSKSSSSSSDRNKFLD